MYVMFAYPQSTCTEATCSEQRSFWLYLAFCLAILSVSHLLSSARRDTYLIRKSLIRHAFSIKWLASYNFASCMISLLPLLLNVGVHCKSKQCQWCSSKHLCGKCRSFTYRTDSIDTSGLSCTVAVDTCKQTVAHAHCACVRSSPD